MSILDNIRQQTQAQIDAIDDAILGHELALKDLRRYRSILVGRKKRADAEADNGQPVMPFAEGDGPAAVEQNPRGGWETPASPDKPIRKSR